MPCETSTEITPLPIIELQFPYVAATLPADHGYALYSAISRRLPDIHTADWIAIATIPGGAAGRGVMIPDPDATLRMRLPLERVPLVRRLAGEILDLNGHSLTLGDPWLASLHPSTRLDARIVTIRGFTEPEPFLAAIRRKLDDLGVMAAIQPGPRRVVRIAHQTVVGFAVSLRDLDQKGSLTLQEIGIGGRRRVGCGILIAPARPSPDPHQEDRVIVLSRGLSS